MMKNLLFTLFTVSALSAQIQIQDFEGSTIPDGWSQQNSGPGNWTFGSNVPPFNDNFPTNAAIFNDDILGNSAGFSVASLLSPTIDLTSFTGVTLSYKYYLNEFSGNGTLAVSVYNGTTWVTLHTYTTDATVLTQATHDVTQYLNANFQVKFTFDDEGGWSWGAAIDDFMLTDILALQDISDKPTFKIFPNPATDRISFDTKGTIETISVIDVMGKVVLKQRPNANNQVDVSALTPGIYVVQVLYDTQTTHTERLIKK